MRFVLKLEQIFNGKFSIIFTKFSTINFNFQKFVRWLCFHVHILSTSSNTLVDAGNGIFFLPSNNESPLYRKLLLCDDCHSWMIITMRNKMKILRRIIAFKLTDAEHIKHCKLFDFLLFVRTYAWMIMRRIPWWCVLHECVASWCIFFPAFIWALNEVIDEKTRYVQPQLPETNGRESKWRDSHWLAAAFSCSCQSFDFIGLFWRVLLFLFLDFESKVRASLLLNIETVDFAKYHIYKCLFFTTNSANKYSKDRTG